MPQRIRDFAVAVVALAAVFTALAIIDERVPAYVKGLADDAASGRLIRPGTELGNFVAAVSATGAADNVFVAAMVAAGAVLLLLMLRT